jgi:hypothetical protein
LNGGDRQMGHGTTRESGDAAIRQQSAHLPFKCVLQRDALVTAQWQTFENEAFDVELDVHA